VETENAKAPMPETESIKPKNFLSRLGGVYFSPGETFTEIGRAPGVLVPIIALIIIGAAAGYYLMQSVDMESVLIERMEEAVQQGRMTQEQLEQQLPMMSRFAGTMMIIPAALGSLVLCLIIAGYAKLFSTFTGAENRFKPIFSVTLYAVIAVSIVQSVLLIIVIHFKRPVGIGPDINSVIASNLGAMLAILLGEDALPEFLMNLFGYIDIFTIWIIALLAVGYSAVSRKLKTGTAAAWLGVAYGLFAVIASFVRARMAS
jgi:hypothetical protein